MNRPGPRTAPTTAVAVSLIQRVRARGSVPLRGRAWVISERIGVRLIDLCSMGSIIRQRNEADHLRGLLDVPPVVRVPPGLSLLKRIDAPGTWRA